MGIAGGGELRHRACRECVRTRMVGRGEHMLPFGFERGPCGDQFAAMRWAKVKHLGGTRHELDARELHAFKVLPRSRHPTVHDAGSARGLTVSQSATAADSPA